MNLELTDEQIALRDTVRQFLAEKASVASHVRPLLDDAASACLRFVDPYGDTVFNPVQAAVLSAELHSVLKKVDAEDDRACLARVADIADRCAVGVHVQLWFIGD